MKRSPVNFPKLLFLLVWANLLFLFGCGSNENSNQNQAQNTNINSQKTNQASDNIEELLDQVQLPELPDEVVWREETLGKNDNRVPGPTDKKLIAVLKYKPEDVPKLLAIIEKNKQPEQVEIGAESWFPEELTAKAQLSGSGMIKGTAYGANQFLNVPYSTGRITRIEGTDYFVLELMTQ